MANRLFKYSLVTAVLLFSSVVMLSAQSVKFTRTEITCNGAADGTMKLERLSGTSSYWFVYLNLTDPSKSDSVGPTTNLDYTFTNLPPVDLLVFYVRDASTGLYIGSLLTSFVDKTALSATVSNTNITCFGALTGTITISGAAGGSGVFDYSINGGSSWQTTGTYSGLAAGSYNVQMRDRNNPGCVKILNPALQITQNAQMNATLNFTNSKCFNSNNGTISITNPTGGSGSGYQYTITGGAPWSANGNYTALIPGTYNVVMRDASVTSCTRVLNNALVLTQPSQLAVQDIVINKGLTCNEGSDGILQANVTGGTQPYSYTWNIRVGTSWVSIGQTSMIATNLVKGRYQVVVNDAGGCGPANAVEYFMEGFTDSIPPVFNYDGAVVTTTCAGQTNGSIDLSASGGIKPYKFSITNGGASGYRTDSLFTNLGAGNYQTWVMDKKGCKKNGASVNVGTTPSVPVNVSIAANPSGSICPGTSVQFTATPVNGGTAPAYQWSLNGTNVGTNQPTYTNNSLANGDQVKVILTSDIRCTTGNPATSNIITAALKTPTAITVQPQPFTQCAGTNVTFSVTANGTNLTYQWRKNGSNISGANASTYKINNIAAGDAGTYSVVVTGDCGTVTSGNAALVVNPATAINTQPQPLIRCAGTSASFSVTAVGTNLTYQWRKNGAAIAGATASTYSIASVAATDAANYSVIVTGDCGGSITSNNASLTVNPATAITAQPVAVTVCQGQPASFSVTATGTNLTYQWKKNGTNISGATGSSYTIAATVAGDAGNYSVVVTGDCGAAVTSGSVALIVNPATAISAQPQPLTRCAGTGATFSVTATGTNLIYQWRKDGSAIPGANGSTYTIASVAAGDAGNYSVIVSGDCGANVTSGNALLTVNPATAITVQPVALTQCAGTSATFSVTAVGTNLKYQWKKNGSNITGATANTYTIASITAADAANYSVTVTGDCGAAITSNAVALIVNPATAITVQPQPATLCAGSNATFNVTAVGINLAYQWRKNGTAIPGANAASYTISGITAADAGNYSVIVSGDCGTNVTSNAVALTVNPATAITVQPVPVIQCAGTSVTFTVTASGVNLKYQWRKDGTNITGATSASYTIASIAAGNAGNYSVVVTGDCGSAVTSANALLTVNPATAITVQPQPLTQCVGTAATFTVTATGTNITYQWRFNGTPIPGATGSSYTIASIAAGNAGNYSVVVSGNCGSNVTSGNAALTVNPATAITVQPSPLTLCAGANALFTVTATGVNLKYQWKKDGTNITGATGSSYTINGITAGDAANYSVEVTGDCGASIISQNAALSLNPATAILTQPAAITECSGNSVTFTVDADGLNLTYQWKKNGTNITGATGDSYTIPSIATADGGNYSVVVTGTCGSVTSANALLTVNNAPAITAQPQNATQCAGTNVTFSVTATGANLNYLWRKNGAPIVPAETNTTLVLNNIDAADAGNYDVVITNLCGDATSTAAVLTVAANPVITQQPVAQDLCEGGDVSFTVNATGTSLTYQWRKDGVNLPGKTGATLDLTSVSVSDAATYDVLVYGMCDSVASDPAVLLVYEATSADIINNDTIVCKDADVQFTVAAGGFGSISYQWQRRYYGSWIDVANDTRISGATTPSLALQAVDYADSGLYRVMVTGDCGTVYSDEVRLDVNSLVATIGTPAPFLINSATTFIEVGVTISNHFLKHDLGFALVAPDGTEVTLKAPSEYCVPNHPVNVDVHFNTTTDAADTINYCLPTNTVNGTYAATGDWNALNGKDPSNGAWQVRIYDAENANGDAFDGLITSATLTFIDLNSDGDTAVVSYNSGVISTGILNPISTELRPTSFVVPIRLMTTCFNSQDARAIVTVQGGVAPFTYEWTGPIALPDESDVMLGPGTYSVLVTDALGCTSVATVEVSAPPAIMFDDVQVSDTLACFGSTDGIIRGKASGGSGSISYMLMPGNLPSEVADSAVFTNLAAGIYTIRATDLNGCSLDTVITLQQREQLVVDIITVPVIGSNSGSITLIASGGLAPYHYSIDNGSNMQDTSEFTNLPAGIYQVIVVDSLGCIFTASVNLSVQLLNVDVTVHDVSCFGLADGSFYLALIDGTGPYTLTGSFTDTLTLQSGAFAFTGQTSGNYDVKIEDKDGRIFMDTIVISEPTQIVATSSVTNATCSAITNDGAIDITITGGSGVFTFDWSNGSTTEDLSNLEAGSYSLIVSDTNGCSSDTFDFAVVGLNTANAYAGENDTICPATEYQLFGSPIADSVRWEPANLLNDSSLVNPVATINTRTPFIYTVYDNGCYDRDTVVLDVFERIGMDIYDPSGPQSIGDSLYLLEGETSPMAATPGFSTYRWEPVEGISDPNAEAVIVSPASTTMYVVFGTTDKGCIESDMVKVVIARKIKIYTGFSPNGDEYNQTWKIENAHQYGERIRVRVFNRWGEPVFDSKGYSTEWDGTRNGRPLPIGAYYYIIDVKDGKSEPYTGTVTILR